jgi:hypothetical protein
LSVGPWGWLLIVYRYRQEDDVVEIVTFQDVRSAESAASSG